MPTADEPAEDTDPDDGTGPSWEATFVEQMARLREARGMSQAELAKRLKAAGLPFHQQTVQRIENGQRPVRLNEAFLIAEELNSSVASMTWRDDYKVRELRDAADALRSTAASAVATLRQCFEQVRDSGREVTNSFISQAVRWEKSGMLEADPLTIWTAYWTLRYMDLQDKLTEAFEAAALTAGDSTLGVDNIERTWPNLLPDDSLDPEAINAWLDELKIDTENLREVESDVMYRELDTDAYFTNNRWPSDLENELKALSERSTTLTQLRSEAIARLADLQVQLAGSAGLAKEKLQKEFTVTADQISSQTLELRAIREEQEQVMAKVREHREVKD